MIFFLCFVPGDRIPPVEIFNFDKLGHVAMFSIEAFLVFATFNSLEIFAGSFWRISLFVMFVCFVLALSTELIQHFLVHKRRGDVFDFMADMFGGALMVALSRLFLKK